MFRIKTSPLSPSDIVFKLGEYSYTCQKCFVKVFFRNVISENHVFQPQVRRVSQESVRNTIKRCVCSSQRWIICSRVVWCPCAQEVCSSRVLSDNFRCRQVSEVKIKLVNVSYE